MGAVFKAEQISLKRTIAVKLLRPEVASSQLLLRRFNAEAEAVAKLSHPNTVNIYDFGQDTDGTLFIAMEYIEGQSLREVIHREAPFPLRRALAIALQVSSSLTDAHSRSIIHRDLKPDNVMLQQRGRDKDIVRVLDFGIAKLRDENRQSQMAMTQAGDMLGTPQYMAPEQIRAEMIDGRTDVYALGCLLYEMITARLPYEAPTIMSLLSKHLMEATVPPSQRRPDLVVPPAIDHLILSAMAKDPKQRPATMELYGEQIAELMATLPTDTMLATTQRPIATAPAQAVVTPPALSAIVPSHGPPMPSYATHGPQMPAPAFAAPTQPPPRSGEYVPPPPAASHPSGYVPPPSAAPPPSGYVPPPPGAPPYNPHPGPPQSLLETELTRPRRGGHKALWIVLGVLVLAGGGVGIYAAQRTTPATDPVVAGGSGSGVGPGSQIAAPAADAAQAIDAADPWGGGSSVAPADVDGEVDAVEPQELTPHAAAGLPPECAKLVKALEHLGACKALPIETRTQLKQVAEQMREGYDTGIPDSVRQQISSSCAMSATAYEQMVTQYGCP